MPFGGFARGGGLRRLRFALVALLAVAAVAAVRVPGADAVRVEVKPSFIEVFTGSDWVGKVTLSYGGMDGKRGPVFFISGVKLANLCDPRGSELKGSVSIRVNLRTQRFDYRGHGFTLSGNVIGNLQEPREIAGLASVSSHGCHSGPWWFGVFAPPRYGALAPPR